MGSVAVALFPGRGRSQSNVVACVVGLRRAGSPPLFAFGRCVAPSPEEDEAALFVVQQSCTTGHGRMTLKDGSVPAYCHSACVRMFWPFGCRWMTALEKFNSMLFPVYEDCFSQRPTLHCNIEDTQIRQKSAAFSLRAQAVVANQILARGALRAVCSSKLIQVFLSAVFLQTDLTTRDPIDVDCFSLICRKRQLRAALSPRT